MSQHNLTHVRHDPAVCLAPGLFRSFKKGDRKKLKTDVLYQVGEDTLHFTGFEPLGALELRVLQGLIGLAAISGTLGRGILLPANPENEDNRRLRDGLNLKGEAAEQDAMKVESTWWQLAKEIGFESVGGQQFRDLRDSVKRLVAVTVFHERTGKRIRSGQLLFDYEAELQEEGTLCISVSPQLAEAILGTRPHTRIDMAEVRALKSDPARLIHQHLCGWIDPGKSQRVGLRTLCEYAWPDPTENANALKKRRRVARSAMEELASLGWTVTEYAAGKFSVQRPDITNVLDHDAA